MPALGLHVFFLSRVLGLESTLSRGKEEIAEDTALWRTDALPDADPVIRQAVVAADGAESAKQASFADLDTSMLHEVDGAVQRSPDNIWKQISPKWYDVCKAGSTAKILPEGTTALFGGASVDTIFRKSFVHKFLERCTELGTTEQVREISGESVKIPIGITAQMKDDLAMKYLTELATAPMSDNDWETAKRYKVKDVESLKIPVVLISSHMAWMFTKSPNMGQTGFFVAETVESGTGIRLDGKGAWHSYRGETGMGSKYSNNNGAIMTALNSQSRDAVADMVLPVMAELHFRYFYHKVFLPAVMVEVK